MARRWAEVLEPGRSTSQGGRAVALDGGCADFEAADARAEGIAGFTLAAADRTPCWPAPARSGLAVACHAVMLFGTRVELREL